MTNTHDPFRPNPSLANQLQQACILVLCGLATFVIVGICSLPISTQYSIDENPALLLGQRKYVAKWAFLPTLLNPDSASFEFDEIGPNTLRVSVRSANAFGGFTVQRFDMVYKPESVMVSDVKEIH